MSTSSPASPDTVILGAGPCGLGLAWELGLRDRPTTLVERSPEVGGLCRTFSHGPYRTDLSIHRLQIDDPALWQRLQRLFAGHLHRVPRKWIHIQLGGRRLPYPLQPLSLLRLPPARLARAAAAYLLAARHRPPPPAEDYQGWFEGRFGAELYRWIAGPLMEKQWGLPGRRLSAAFGEHRRVSAGVAALLAELPGLSRLFPRAIPPDFVYGKEGSGALMSLLGDAVQRLGTTLRLGCQPRRIHHRKARVERLELESGEELPCPTLCSTIPLPALVRRMHPAAPAPLLRVVEELRFRDLVVVALILRREQHSVDHVTYFPEPDLPFSRTFEPKNASPALVPPGRTILGFELPCFAGDEIWQRDDDELLAWMGQFGPRLGFGADEVAGGFVVRVPEAYPLYQVGHRRKVTRVLRWLHGELRNLYCTGRNSLFRLDNIGHALTMGFDLAHHLTAEPAGEPRSWHRGLDRYERFSYID